MTTLSGAPVHPGQAGEHATAVAIIEILLVPELAGRTRPRVSKEQRDQLLGCRRRNGTEEDGVHVADDDAIHADAHPEGERDRQRESGAPTHAAQRIAEIGAKVVEPPRAALVAHRLPVRVPAAERHQRAAPRRVRGQSFAHQPRRLHVEVKAELLLHAILGLAPMQDGAETGSYPPEPAHEPRSSTSAIAAAKRFHLSTSSPNALRPCRVMV